MDESRAMITEAGFYREQAAEAQRQAGEAVSEGALSRCRTFAAWWSAIADALEAGDVDGARAIFGNTTSLKR